MTPEEIDNESMRVLKEKEIEEVDQRVEKDMIELTIVEAAQNIEKYQKETKAWKDKKVVKKHQNWRFGVKKKEELGKPKKTSRILGRAIHSKRNRLARGFSLVIADWRRIAIFVECRQPEKVLPLRNPELDRFTLEYFAFS
jgi:hypothetical protein